MTYEIGLKMTGDICWAYGGYKASVHDITMARRGILTVLPSNEKIVADKGYFGEPDKIVTPHDSAPAGFNRAHKLIMARHEGINKSLKDFRCLGGVWKHGWKAHVKMIYAVVNLTQLKLEHGEPMPAHFED